MTLLERSNGFYERTCGSLEGDVSNGHSRQVACFIILAESDPLEKE